MEFVDAYGNPLQEGVTYIGGKPYTLSADELRQNQINAIQDAANARAREVAGQWAAHPELAMYAGKGYDFDSAMRLYSSGYGPDGYTGAAALARNLALQEEQPKPWSPGVVSEPTRGSTFLPAPPVAAPVVAEPFRPSPIILPSLPQTIQPTSEPTTAGESPMSLKSLISNAAKNVIDVFVPGGKVITSGAKALLESRRGDPPAPTVGMSLGVPSLQDLQDAWQGVKNVATSSYQTGQNMATNMMAGVPLVGPGGATLGAVKPKQANQKRLVCPRGYVLAVDGNCYPKAMLGRNLRKWKPDPRPVVSRSDQKAIRRSAAAKKRLVKVTKDAGAYASLHKPHHDAPKRKR